MKIRMAVAACLLLTTGCVDGGINKRNPWLFEPGAAAKTTTTPLRERQINLPAVLHTALKDNAKSKPYLTSFATDKTGYDEVDLDKLILAADMSGDKAVRNSVIAQLMAASTTNCGIYLNGLRSGQVQSRLLSDIAATTFGIAGSLTEPVESAKILSGLAAFSTSAGASVDRNIFAQQGAELVADAIVQVRAVDRAYIEGRMNDDLGKWPMGLALTDFARFHADCSMLRGLSQMREAVSAREFEVRAVRSAALAVARSGGSGEEVAAAIAGSGEHVAAYRPAPTTTSPTGSDYRADLENMRLAALKCFDDAKSAASKDVTLKTLAPPVDEDACSPIAKTKWETRYTTWVGEDLKTLDLGTANNYVAADGSYQAADKALSAAKAASSTPDPSVIAPLEQAKTDAGKKRDAEWTKRRDDIIAKIDHAKASTLLRIDADIQRVSTTRSAAVSAISGIEAPRPASDVELVLKTIAGDLAAVDPAFILSIKAAHEVQALSGPPALAAANARATIFSVVGS
jgi:hypothetical protein